MPGPDPAAHRRRRNTAEAPSLRLPAAGRQGPVPAWPPSAGELPAPGELSLWRRLWTLPQAVAWEQLHAELSVARYVVLTYRPERPVALESELRRLEDTLGLSPRGLRMLRWEITDDVAPPSPSRAARAVDADVAPPLPELTDELLAEFLDDEA